MQSICKVAEVKEIDVDGVFGLNKLLEIRVDGLDRKKDEEVEDKEVGGEEVEDQEVEDKEVADEEVGDEYECQICMGTVEEGLDLISKGCLCKGTNAFICRECNVDMWKKKNDNAMKEKKDHSLNYSYKKL